MKSSKHDVLVVGELNVDIILNQIDGFPEVGKEILAKNMTVTLGSSAAIFASNLSSLGASVAFLGKVGKDEFAELIITSLQDRGVNTDHIIQDANLNTGATLVMNYGMDRANITYPGAMESLSEPEVADDILQSASHLHVSSVFLQPQLKERIVSLFSRAKQLGLTTSLDPQWDPHEQWQLDLPTLLPHLDLFMPNHKELMYLTQASSIEAGIEQIKEHSNTVVIKDGEHGAALYQEGNLIRKPAFLNEQAVDCIGAGDSFGAGFIAQYIKGKPLVECLEYANLMGAINTTAAGGTAAFRSLDHIAATARSKFDYHHIQY